MDWNTILGWGSPIGLGVLLLGIGMMWSGWAKLLSVRINKKAK